MAIVRCSRIGLASVGRPVSSPSAPAIPSTVNSNHNGQSPTRPNRCSPTNAIRGSTHSAPPQRQPNDRFATSDPAIHDFARHRALNHRPEDLHRTCRRSNPRATSHRGRRRQPRRRHKRHSPGGTQCPAPKRVAGLDCRSPDDSAWSQQRVRGGTQARCVRAEVATSVSGSPLEGEHHCSRQCAAGQATLTRVRCDNTLVAAPRTAVGLGDLGTGGRLLGGFFQRVLFDHEPQVVRRRRRGEGFAGSRSPVCTTTRQAKK